MTLQVLFCNTRPSLSEVDNTKGLLFQVRLDLWEYNVLLHSLVISHLNVWIMRAMHMDVCGAGHLPGEHNRFEASTVGKRLQVPQPQRRPHF